MKYFIGIASAVFASTALADTPVTTSFEGTFDDAVFAVENAIINEGLVIDYVSHVGAMLNRTGADVGSSKELFKNADIFVFCSAKLSREVMEANPMNISHCPYGIFVFENQNGVSVGYRSYPEGEMQKVQSLLAKIVASAVEE